MPPKNKFSREQIVNTAFKIADTEGIDKITIRKVAGNMGSSIAPIYVNFNEAEELRQAVIKRTVEISRDMLARQNTDSPFEKIGFASLQFASEHPVLFRDFVMKPNDNSMDYDRQMSDDLIEYMKEDPELQSFSDDELEIILFKMRIFQTGLSVMIANGLISEKLNMEDMKGILNSAAEDVVTSSHIRRKKNS